MYRVDLSRPNTHSSCSCSHHFPATCARTPFTNAGDSSSPPYLFASSTASLIATDTPARPHPIFISYTARRRTVDRSDSAHAGPFSILSDASFSDSVNFFWHVRRNLLRLLTNDMLLVLSQTGVPSSVMLIHSTDSTCSSNLFRRIELRAGTALLKICSLCSRSSHLYFLRVHPGPPRNADIPRSSPCFSKVLPYSQLYAGYANIYLRHFHAGHTLDGRVYRILNSTSTLQVMFASNFRFSARSTFTSVPVTSTFTPLGQETSCPACPPVHP